MSPTETLSHYAEMLHLAEEQVALASRGELSALQELTQRWDELARALPEHPPQEAAPLLERASVLSERLRAELQRVRETLLGDLADTARACRAAQGYALPAQSAHRIDHCA